MDELQLDKQLYLNIVNWMRHRYAISTIHERSLYLRKVFKNYKVLNRETLKKIMRNVKYQYQRATIKMINDYCYDNDIDFYIRIPHVKKQAEKLPELLTMEEIKLMVNSAPKPYDLAIRCIFNMGAGLRVSEIIKMSWNDIRWIDWMNNKDSYGVAQIKSGKGMKDRVVNIPKKLMQDLYDYAIHKGNLNEYHVPTGGMIFPFTFREEKFYKSDLYKNNIELWKNRYIKSKYNWFRYNILQCHCEKALNKKIKIHQLRHSRATYLHTIEKIPIEDIQLLLGHKSLNTTMLYIKINPKNVFNKLTETRQV